MSTEGAAARAVAGTRLTAEGPTRHIRDDLLMDYATGACRETPSVLVAAHLTLCPECRRRTREFECIGGALLMSAPTEPCDEAAFAALMARIATADDPREATGGGFGRLFGGNFNHGPDARIVPRPLLDYLPAPAAALPWKRVARGVAEVRLSVGADDDKYRARLLRIDAGGKMVGSAGAVSELMVVLAGSLSNRWGDFRRGDVAIHDGGFAWLSVAGREEDCLCFAVASRDSRDCG